MVLTVIQIMRKSSQTLQFSIYHLLQDSLFFLVRFKLNEYLCTKYCKTSYDRKNHYLLPAIFFECISAGTEYD